MVLEATERLRPHSVVLLESSPPAEVQGLDLEVVPQPGSFDPEQVYGRFPLGMASRPESALARRTEAGDLGAIAALLVTRRLWAGVPSRPRLSDRGSTAQRKLRSPTSIIGSLCASHVSVRRSPIGLALPMVVGDLRSHNPEGALPSAGRVEQFRASGCFEQRGNAVFRWRG